MFSPHAALAQPPANRGGQQSTFRRQETLGLAGGHLIHKWALRFSGAPNSLKIDDFIFRVERQARLHGVSEGALTIGVGDLLTDGAAHWFWTFQRKYEDATWNELRQAFIRRYAPRRESDYDIRARIESRKQKSGESFGDFAQDLEAIAVRLTRRMQEDELVEVLRRNMLMYLRKALWRTSTDTVEDLLRECAEYEHLCEEERFARRKPTVSELDAEAAGSMRPSYESHRCMQPPQPQQYAPLSQLLQGPHQQQYTAQQQYAQPSQFNQPPQPYQTMTQYAPPQQPHSQQYAHQQQFAASQQPQQYATEYVQPTSEGEFIEALQPPGMSRADQIICWNCRDIGHAFSQCRQPQTHRFCFSWRGPIPTATSRPLPAQPQTAFRQPTQIAQRPTLAPSNPFTQSNAAQ